MLHANGGVVAITEQLQAEGSQLEVGLGGVGHVAELGHLKSVLADGVSHCDSYEERRSVPSVIGHEHAVEVELASSERDGDTNKERSVKDMQLAPVSCMRAHAQVELNLPQVNATDLVVIISPGLCAVEWLGASALLGARVWHAAAVLYVLCLGLMSTTTRERTARCGVVAAGVNGGLATRRAQTRWIVVNCPSSDEAGVNGPCCCLPVVAGCQDSVRGWVDGREEFGNAREDDIAEVERSCSVGLRLPEDD